MNHEKRQWREALGNKRFLIVIAGLWLIGGLLILNWLTHIPSMFLKLINQAPSLQTIVATVLHPANFLWPDFTYLLMYSYAPIVGAKPFSPLILDKKAPDALHG